MSTLSIALDRGDAHMPKRLERLPFPHEVVGRDDDLDAWNDAIVDLGGVQRTLAHLRRCSSEPKDIRLMRRMVRKHGHGAPGEDLTDAQVLHAFAGLLVARRVVLRRGRGPRRAPSLLPLEMSLDVESLQGERLRLEEGMLHLTVVEDSTNAPIPGVRLVLLRPDGSIEQLETDAAGEATCRGVGRGGCDVSSPLAGRTVEETLAFVKQGTHLSAGTEPGMENERGFAIASVVEHKVRTGETLDEIAKDFGITKTELCDFNWGTSDPDDVDDMLCLIVGCTETDPLTGRYVLDDSDDPGIIYLPREWKSYLADLDDHYFIHVRAVGGQEDVFSV